MDDDIQIIKNITVVPPYGGGHHHANNLNQQLQQGGYQQPQPTTSRCVREEDELISRKRKADRNISFLLEQFNEKVVKKSHFKKSLPANEVLAGKLYHILKISKIKTQYGVRILLEFENVVFFLPAYMVDFLNADQIAEINNHCNIYMVSDGKGKYRLIEEDVYSQHKMAENQ